MKSGRYRSTGRKMKNFQKTGLEYRIRIGLILCKIKGIYNGWFEIDNSKRIIDNIVNDLTNNFEKKFSQEELLLIGNKYVSNHLYVAPEKSLVLT